MLVLIRRYRQAAIAVAAAGWMTVSAPAALADRLDPAPKALDGVGLTQKLDAKLPLDLAFTGEDGSELKLSGFFRPGRPVILTLNYYRCPMLCTLELNGLVDALKELSLSPGKDFEIVTVSIDPLETPALARQKKETYLESLGKPGAGEGWRFLTGRKEAIESLAGAVGFGYRYVEEDRQYAHPAAIYVITPEGRVSRILNGVVFDPRTLRLALVEASRGQIGSPLDQFVLFCFHFDETAGRYAPVAMRLMQLGGALTAVLLGVVLAALWVREKRGRRRT